MGKRTQGESKKSLDNAPESLSDHPFFGLQLDEEQTAFRDAIWSEDKLIIFCDAKAGSGKTQLAVMTAELLYKYGRYKGIVYITAPVQEEKLGFLPGTVQEKLSVYNEPFYQAALKADINIQQAFPNMESEKNGTNYIECISHNYLRGCNFENKVVIIDEAQNFYLDELKKVLTRMHDSCKVIVIGHTGQIDLYHRPENSGFASYIDHYKGLDWSAICTLSKNYRGKISNHADSLSSNTKQRNITNNQEGANDVHSNSKESNL